MVVQDELRWVVKGPGRRVVDIPVEAVSVETEVRVGIEDDDKIVHAPRDRLAPPSGRPPSSGPNTPFDSLPGCRLSGQNMTSVVKLLCRLGREEIRGLLDHKDKCNRIVQQGLVYSSGAQPDVGWRSG